ncbi:MAG: hypothetical protein JSR77_11495 [Planctomycetes bacterium]|nr:hypothetical protein [Planctomycetota bacterium]
MSVKSTLVLSALAALTLGAGSAIAFAPHAPFVAPAEEAAARIGDAFPFDTCPVDHKKFSVKEAPISKLYEGREVRFCSPACPAKFEKDLAANIAKIDDQIIKDQAPIYPLKTSLVTGKDLPAKPYEFVYGNRLIRLGDQSEKAAFMKDGEKMLAKLNEAVITAQGKNYPATQCLVTAEDLDMSSGKPVEIVVAGRMIRLCCNDCKGDIDAAPAKFIAKLATVKKGEKFKAERECADEPEKKPETKK